MHWNYIYHTVFCFVFFFFVYTQQVLFVLPSTYALPFFSIFVYSSTFSNEFNNLPYELNYFYIPDTNLMLLLLVVLTHSKLYSPSFLYTIKCLKDLLWWFYYCLPLPLVPFDEIFYSRSIQNKMFMYALTCSDTLMFIHLIGCFLLWNWI